MSGKYIFIIIAFMFSTMSSLNLAQQIRVDIKDLSKDADLIITGKVSQQTSSWNEDKTRIYTIATIQVEDYIKGNVTGNSVSVKYLGGEVGDVGETYSHVPTFENNEDVLIFLKKNESNSDFSVLYGEEGKISLINDSQTGELLTSSNVRVSSLKTQIKNYITD
jgi:hypothetical protein